MKITHMPIIAIDGEQFSDGESTSSKNNRSINSSTFLSDVTDEEDEEKP